MFVGKNIPLDEWKQLTIGFFTAFDALPPHPPYPLPQLGGVLGGSSMNDVREMLKIYYHIPPCPAFMIYELHLHILFESLRGDIIYGWSLGSPDVDEQVPEEGNLDVEVGDHLKHCLKYSLSGLCH